MADVVCLGVPPGRVAFILSALTSRTPHGRAIELQELYLDNRITEDELRACLVRPNPATLSLVVSAVVGASVDIDRDPVADTFIVRPHASAEDLT